MTQDFWEKVGLLLLTALITGVAIPLVLKTVDARRADEQKRLDEARVQRAEEI